MKTSAYNLPRHLSIIWGVTLAIITLLEWNSLERDPVRQEILSPFIDRQIEVSLVNAVTEAPTPELVFQEEAAPEAELGYQVELSFNGPLFLAVFFIPILAFHGLGLLWRRIRHS